MFTKKGKFFFAITFCMIIPVTNSGITREDLIIFYEKIVEKIAAINHAVEELEVIPLLQNIASIITPSNEEIPSEEEVTLRKEVETHITAWLIWHELPETNLTTAIEQMPPQSGSSWICHQPSSSRLPLWLRHSDCLEQPFPHSPPPSPASPTTATRFFPDMALEYRINTSRNSNFRVKINNFAHLQLLSSSQIFILHLAANQLPEIHSHHLERLLFFILAKNLNALALSNYSSEGLGLDLLSAITGCLEFYTSQQLISHEVYFRSLGRLQKLSSTGIKDFIPGFFSIVYNWLGRYQYDFSCLLDRIITQLEDTDDDMEKREKKDSLPKHLFGIKNLQMTPRATLISYVDALVFYGCLHPSDGWRIRSIMMTAYSELLASIMLESLAISSTQCFIMSNGFQIFPSHTKALEVTFLHHCARGEISHIECQNRVSALYQGRIPLFAMEANFYRQLLASKKIVSLL